MFYTSAKTNSNVSEADCFQVFWLISLDIRVFCLPEMKPRNNLVNEIQYLTISFTLDLQENVHKQIKKTCYMSAGEAGRHVVGFGDSSIDVFLEVQNKRYS